MPVQRAQMMVMVGNNDVVSPISRTSVERMKLKTSDTMTAVIKATEVMVVKD